MAPSGSRYIWLITFLTAVIVNQTCAKFPYGSPCTQDSQCQDGGSMFDVDYSFFDDSYSVCNNGRCNCSSSQIRQFKNNNYECQRYVIAEKVHCQLDDPNTCINGVCKKKILQEECICNDGFVMVEDTCREILSVDYAEDCNTPANGSVPVCNYDRNMHCKSGGKCGCFSGYFIEKDNETCISKNDYVKKYPEETIADLNEPCGSSIKGLPKLCKEEANMTCQDKKCLCTKDFYPVESNNTCETKKSWAEEHNLTSYKVMPGEYCYDDADCITGLDCFKKKCACPYPCTFHNLTSSCDCGKVSAMEGASPAILVGVIGGFIIIVFWGHMIKKTIRKGNDKFTSGGKDQNDESVTASQAPAVTLTEPYRIKSTCMGPSTPAPNPAPAPTNVPPYATTAPGVPEAPLGFSAPTSSAPVEQPPPYSGPPAPYPVNSTMPPVSSTSPSALPYPVNPVPASAPTSASIPSAPVTDVHLSNTTAYPLNPVMGAAPNSVGPTVGAPNYSSGDASAPPPYTPTTQTDATAPPAMDIYKPVIS